MNKAVSGSRGSFWSRYKRCRPRPFLLSTTESAAGDAGVVTRPSEAVGNPLARVVKSIRWSCSRCVTMANIRVSLSTSVGGLACSSG